MTSFKDEYEKFYLEISKEISLELLINISKKYEKILNFKIKRCILNKLWDSLLVPTWIRSPISNLTKSTT